jgi:hypothetical protein
MRQLYTLTAAASVLIAGCLLFVTPSRADTLSCSSVNGVTQCIGSDGLDCRTIAGRMICAPGSKGHCETVADGITTCTNGNVRQSLKTGSPKPRQRDNDGAK